MTITAGATAVAGVWTTYILRRFVEMLTPEKVFADYAEPATLPKRAGGYVARWNVPVRHAGNTTALNEASASDGEVTGTTINNVEATIAQYGDWMRVSDLADETAISGTLDVYTEQFADAGRDTIDLLIRNEATGAGISTGFTNFLHSGDTSSGGATLATTDTAVAQDFSAIAGFFNGQNARGWANLAGDFVWIMNPQQEVQLQTDVTTGRLSWSEVNKHVPVGYDQLINVHKFVGRLAGVTAIRTTNVGTMTEDVAAYRSVALARWGVGWLGLGMKGPRAPTMKIKRPGPSDTSQPLDMYMTIGYKINAVARVLDASRGLIVYSAT